MMKNKERRQTYFNFLIIFTLAQMVCPTLQYSKVAAVGPKTVQKPVTSSRMTMARQYYYPFHYSAGEVSKLGQNGPFLNPLEPSIEKRRGKKGNLEKTVTSNRQLHLNSFNVGHHKSYHEDEEDGSKIRSIKKSTRKFPMTYTSSSSKINSLPSDNEDNQNFASSRAAAVSALRALGEGLSVKFVNFVERTVPKQYLDPLKNVMAAGKRVYQNWEIERKSRGENGEARQHGGGGHHGGGGGGGNGGGGGGGTSFSDIMDYGWEQVSKLRESYQNLWPPSDELAHRHEGWGHSGWPSSSGHYSSGWTGWSGSESGLDTFALLAALAFGAFLLQLFLALSTTTARALGRSTSIFEDWMRPLLTSDLDTVPDFLKKITNHDDSPLLEENDTLIPEKTKENEERIKRDVDKVSTPLKKSVESRVAAGEVLDCEKIKEEMKGVGRTDVNLIIKNAKCPPILS